MRLHRFYLSQQISDKNEVIIDDEKLLHQITSVFRMKNGDKIVLFDGSGTDYICEFEIGDINRAKIISKEPSRFIPNKNVILCQAVVKKDNFEFIVEKATEIGVSKIIPLIASRSEKKNLNEERLGKIIIEASEQSGRGNIPELKSIQQGLENVLKSYRGKMVAFHTGENCLEIDKGGFTDKEIMVFIGPEGGWTDEEVAMFHKYNVPLYSLGKQVLRAETASLIALYKVIS